MRHPSSCRSGLTLLEVMIATGLMLLVMAAILEAMATSQHLESHAAAKDELAQQSDTIMRAIADDLTASGWHLPTNEDFNRDGNPNPTVDEDLNGNGVIDTITYANQNQGEDRFGWYYPYVTIQDTDGSLAAGFGAKFQHIIRPIAAVVLPTLPKVLPGVATDATTPNLADSVWSTSFHARSQELVFLKATVGMWDRNSDSFVRRDSAAVYAATASNAYNGQLLDFGGTRAQWLADPVAQDNHAALGVLYPSGWSATATGFAARTPNLPYGVVLDAGWYDAAAEGTDEDPPVKVQWETINAPTFSANDYSPYMLREYAYAVVPSPIGFGRLVRSHRIHTSAMPAGTVQGYDIGNVLPTFSGTTYRMLVDRVLSDDVTRIVFDTYRTVDFGATEVTTLGVNQVRVRLFLARRQVTNPSVVVSHVVEAIVNMRARSSQSDIKANSDALGTAPIGISH